MALEERKSAEKITQKVAQVLLRTRENSGISRKKLAQDVGCTTTTITRVEEGLQVPGIELFGTICLSLGKKPSEVFRAAEDLISS